MAVANVELIKQMYARSKETGDVEGTLVDFFDPDVVWVDKVTNFGRVVGHQGFLDAMANLAERGYEADADPEAFEELEEETVLVRGYTRLRQGTSYTDLPSHSVFVVREGKVVAGAGATRREEALAALERPS